MAAGLGFKTFTTGEVLTAADTNGYLMQGVLVFDDAAARDAAITAPAEGQFAYLKDTDTTTYYTSSAWANLDTTGMVNPMTTTADIIYSSSGSTPARLGIGSNADVLTVAGGVPTWAAPAAAGIAISQIATGALSGTSVTISSLSTYDQIFVRIMNGGSTSGSSDQILRTRINNNSGSNYLLNGWEQEIGDGSRTTGFQNSTAIIAQNDSMYSTGLGALWVSFENCKATGFTTGQALRYYTATSQADGQAVVSFIYTQAEAVSSIVLTLDGTATFNSGTYTVWGG